MPNKPTLNRMLRRAQRKLAEAELKLKRTERSVAFWRRKVADLTYENKCLVQNPLWTEEAPSPNEQGEAPPNGADTQ